MEISISRLPRNTCMPSFPTKTASPMRITAVPPRNTLGSGVVKKCQAWHFFTTPEPNVFLGGTAVILIGLAVFVGNEGIQVLRGKREIEISTTEIPSRAE